MVSVFLSMFLVLWWPWDGLLSVALTAELQEQSLGVTSSATLSSGGMESIFSFT